MAKYYGKIGYCVSVEETDLDIYEEKIVEKQVYGDVVVNNRRLSTSTMSINDDISISNQFSIIADPYAYSNFHNMRYATYMGQKWRIISAMVERPRIIITLGGVYNEESK